MESLFNYGSDEEITGSSDAKGKSGLDTTEQDVNYDNITMDMSEDSGSNQDHSSRSQSIDSTVSISSLQNASELKMASQLSSKPERKRSRSRSSDDVKSKDKNLSKKRKHSNNERRKPRENERNVSRSKDRHSSRHRRSRSPSHKHDRFVRSRSPRDRGVKYSRREHSPNRRYREKERSPRRSNFDRKPSKLFILEKLGIELKLPENLDKDNTSLPSYYNPVAMNPAKYAAQMAKRKLLWANNATKQATTKNEFQPDNSKGNLWQGATFSQDQDGKMTAKFQRLMGMKQGPSLGESSSNSSDNGTSKDLIKKQEELFSSMELQYEVARAATHTQRGVGLGFGVHHYPR